MVGRFNYLAPAYDDLNSEGNGIYRIQRKLSGGLDYSWKATGKFSWGLGAFYNQEDLGGENVTFGLGIRWNPNDQLTFNLHLNYRSRHEWLLHQSGRDFTTFDAEHWQPRLTLDYFLTAKQQIRASLQWVAIRAYEQEFFLVPLTPGDLIQTPKPPGPPDSFGLSQLSFQVRYRWEIAPLSDLFLVYTRVSDRAIGLGTNSFPDLFDDGWQNPLADIFVVKVRYRFGS
jgi:hypothetical protein